MRHQRLLALSLLGPLSLGCPQTEPPSLADDVNQISKNVNCNDAEIDTFLQKLPTPINYYKELVIIEPSVVDDLCRVQFAKFDETGNPCERSSEGVWAFGYLMSRVAPSTGVDDFLKQWLMTWKTDQIVNGEVVPARPNIDYILKTKWADDRFPRDTAPFRLLAIVSRLDLADRVGIYKESPLGEVRFLYGFLAENGQSLQATVSLEYAVPATAALPNVQAWANQFHELSGLAMTGSSRSDYNRKLESILAPITSYPAQGKFGAGTGPALLRVRTNESAFGPDGTWQMREYRFMTDAGAPCDSANQAKCFLKVATLPQTPASKYNISATLSEWITANQEKILSRRHEVPEKLADMPFLAGSITTTGDPISTGWAGHPASAPVDSEARHQFSIATCNGCHYIETLTRNLHISPRAPGVRSSLSDFMRLVALESAQQQAVERARIIPTESGVRYFNEPRRRVCEQARLMSGRQQPYAELNNSVVVNQ